MNMQNLPETPLLSAHELFKGTKHLPALPTTASKIIVSLTDEFATLENVAESLEQDAAISARILGLANSAFYGQPRPVNSVREAVIRVLGLDLTRGIALGIALRNAFDESRCPAFKVNLHWSISVQTATINVLLAAKLPSISDEDRKLAYTTGLLANIGILALVTTEPDVMNSLLGPSTGPTLSEKLRNTLGFDQYEAGRALAQIWDLPEKIIACLRSPHTQLAVDQAPDIVGSTALAHLIARHLELRVPDSSTLTALGHQFGIGQLVDTLITEEVKELENIEEFVTAITAN